VGSHIYPSTSIRPGTTQWLSIKLGIGFHIKNFGTYWSTVASTSHVASTKPYQVSQKQLTVETGMVKKVKCTLVQALRFCTGRTDHSGSRGIALLYLDHVTISRRGVRVTTRPLFTPRKDPVPIVQEAGWAPGPVWTGAGNLAPPPPGFDPRTVQPVASRYTEYATRPT
jgi:hypothetical protein